MGYDTFLLHVGRLEINDVGDELSGVNGLSAEEKLLICMFADAVDCLRKKSRANGVHCPAGKHRKIVRDINRHQDRAFFQDGGAQTVLAALRACRGNDGVTAIIQAQIRKNQGSNGIARPPKTRLRSI